MNTIKINQILVIRGFILQDCLATKAKMAEFKASILKRKSGFDPHLP